MADTTQVRSLLRRILMAGDAQDGAAKRDAEDLPDIATAGAEARPADSNAHREDNYPNSESGAIAVEFSDPALIAVAQLVAIVDWPISTDSLTDVIAAEKSAAAAALAHLQTRQLLDNGRFRDAHVRAGILEQIPFEHRKRLHHAAAGLLYEAGAPTGLVADHLVRAGYARHDWTLELLSAAADEAIANDNITFAVTVLDFAYRLRRDPVERAAIAARLVLLEWRLNPSAASRNFARVVAALHAGCLQPDVLPFLVRYFLWHGRASDAHRALQQLQAAAPERPGETDSDLFYLRCWMAFVYPGERDPEDLDPNRTAVLDERFLQSDDAPSAADGSWLCIALLENAPIELIVSRAERLLKRHRLDAASTSALTVAIDALIYADELETATAWCDALTAEASARTAPTWRCVFLIRRAEVLLRRAELDAAVAQVLEALTQVSAENLGNYIARVVAVLVRAYTAAGRHSDAANLLEREMPGGVFASRYGLDYLRARGEFRLATNDPEGALHDFRRVEQLVRAWNADNPMLVPWRNDIAAAYLRMGDRTRAREYAAMHIDKLEGAMRHRSVGVSLRLIAATADAYDRIVLLREAEVIARTFGDKLELATVLGDMANAEDHVGNLQRARSLLRRAINLAEECGALTLRNRLTLDTDVERTDILPIIAGSAAIAELSPSERRVAGMASEGMRNKDIADQLGITTSTVEQHLTRAYRKLKVSRRADLRFVLPQPDDS